MIHDYSASSLLAEEMDRNDADLENDQQDIQKLIQHRSEKNKTAIPIKKTPVKILDSQVKHHRIRPMTTRSSKHSNKIY
ncbi:hypothetical protein L5515_011061 [Caenorhabditis briggsae]|uniref:Uncharacterized protein n=1 Tax=Caenorhabditis briggsae TaxID=6238 RepID=A0AAE9AEG3_CAEBR|nr:hypothetical protein L3Y34_003930 [Caenorhabditis briggsae]UMM28048.1 hypothetical protein L5515_011061 [Caenorhabditis briggsae]